MKEAYTDDVVVVVVVEIDSVLIEINLLENNLNYMLGQLIFKMNRFN